MARNINLHETAETAFWTAWVRNETLMKQFVAAVRSKLSKLDTGEMITTSELMRRIDPDLSQRGIKFILNGLFLARRDGHLDGWWISDPKRSGWSYGKPSIRWMNRQSAGAKGLEAML